MLAAKPKRVLRQILILGLAVLALATVPSQKPGLTPKWLMFPTLFLSCDKALGSRVQRAAKLGTVSGLAK